MYPDIVEHNANHNLSPPYTKKETGTVHIGPKTLATQHFNACSKGCGNPSIIS